MLTLNSDVNRFAWTKALRLNDGNILEENMLYKEREKAFKLYE